LAEDIAICDLRTTIAPLFEKKASMKSWCFSFFSQLEGMAEGDRESFS